MIAHALSIVCAELDAHLKTTFQLNTTQADLGNVAELPQSGNGNSNRDHVVLSVVNIQEERTLKNSPAHVRDDVNLRVRYENPPTFLNLAVLVAAPHPSYLNALTALSRAMTFFQYRNVFTHDSVAPASLLSGPPDGPNAALDRLSEFKLIFNLWSPTLEEINDMWGMLGGKQFPFALYSVRMLDLKFQAAALEAGLITEVVSNFGHKSAVS